MNQKKHVVVLGTGPDQAEILAAVGRAGYSPIGFDREPYAGSERGIFIQISNRDAQKIIDACRKLRQDGHEISGVIAAGSEVPEVVATVQNAMGLHGMPVAAAFAMRDKRLYKRALRAAGVPCTREATWDDKVVVSKPINGAGSRGVRIGSWEDVWDPSEDNLIEAYQPGPQISAEIIVWGGTAMCVAFADRHYDHANMSTPKELGVSMPASNWMHHVRSSEAMAKAAEVFGINRGTLKADLVLTNQGPLIIECTSRLSGGPLAKLVQKSTGVDYFVEAVHVACGRAPIAPTHFRTYRKVSLDMGGNETEYDEAIEKYVPKELPECV